MHIIKKKNTYEKVHIIKIVSAITRAHRRAAAVRSTPVICGWPSIPAVRAAHS